jgi:hypothetical protein
MASTIEENERDFAAALGHFIIAYNLADGFLRGLLFEVCLPTPVSTQSIATANIMVVEMGSLAVENALQSYAEAAAPPKTGELISHAVNFVAIMREHRNFYVHGITSIQHFSDHETSGWIRTLSAKGVLKEHAMLVKVTDIQSLTEQCHVLARYLRHIRNFYESEIGRRSQGDDSFLLQPPHKPTLPKRLAKPLRRWTEFFPPLHGTQG